MYFAELFETPEDDLRSLSYAQTAANKFMNWLMQHNTDVPLNDIKELWHVPTKQGEELWLVRATDIGLLQQDLYLGVGWRPAGGGRADAYVTTFYDSDGSQKKTMLVMLCKSNPGSKTDVAFMLNWSNFAHEFTHVLDYRRGYTRHKDNILRKIGRNVEQYSSPEQYYNSPIEFNGFYKQGLHEIIYALMRLRQRAQTYPHRESPDQFKNMSYQAFCDQYEIYFNGGWLRNLNPVYRRKFEKRFAQFFQVVQKTWPDMDAIKHIEAENKYYSQANQKLAAD